MNVLSLFDGISGAKQALKNLGIECQYYASEIDKFAISISRSNHNNITHLGDVKRLRFGRGLYSSLEIHADFLNKETRWITIGGVDLLIGGSPCQDLSCAKQNREGLEGSRSSLFYEYIRVLKMTYPKFFVLENVSSMSNESKSIITKELFGIEPVEINSALVTAQNRKRVYWVGELQEDGTYKKAEVSQPKDRGILLKDILEHGQVDRDKSYCLDASYYKGISSVEEYKRKCRRQIVFCDSDIQILKEGRTEEGKQLRKEIRQSTGKDSTSRSVNSKCYYGKEGLKSNCLVTGLGVEGMIVLGDKIRKLTPVECERLQGYNDGYTSFVSNTQRYKALGNSFTVPVIEHILKEILKEERDYRRFWSIRNKKTNSI